MTVPAASALGRPPGSWDGSIIDVDVHAVLPSLRALDPYLPAVWRQFTAGRGWSQIPASDHAYPAALPSSARPEWRPTDGRPPASSVELLREHVLDAWDVEAAILNCCSPVDDGNPDLSAALAAAINDWLVAEWLDREPRLRASIVMPLRDPAAMVKEINRVGTHPGFVQVLLPVRSGTNYGDRIFNPVFEAIVRHDLVAGVHWGGSNDRQPPTPSGWPSWYVEEYVAERNMFVAQLVSLIAGGVFQSFPELRVAVLEAGFLWLPSLFWRMDKDWKGLRREVPWVDRPPSQLVRDHVRFSSAPLDAGPPEELRRTIGWLGSEELVMFATDYPHFHDDDLPTLLDAMPHSMRPSAMSESARRWYRL